MRTRAKDVFVCEPIAVKGRVLREVAAKRALIAEVLRYEATIDGEWGCCHSASEIAAGKCRGANRGIPALQHMAAVDSDHPDYRQEWAPEGSSDAR